MGNSEPPREAFMELVQAVLRNMTGLRYWGGVYPNPPRVERNKIPGINVTEYPCLGLVEVPGSLVDRGSHEDDEDRFRFDLYGRINGSDVVPPTQWAQRLNHDCKRTLRQAVTRPDGALSHIAYAIDFGEEDLGFDEMLADFVLPCTATLRYDLGAD